MALQFAERAGLLPLFTAQNLRHRGLASRMAPAGLIHRMPQMQKMGA
jgi:hypothetical protein